MPHLTLMFKTVSSDCNLDCSYCYYRESLEGSRPRRRVDRAVLERLIPDYMGYVADTRAASFGWQGGEPTLAGLDLFRWIVDLQARSAAPGTVISNDIQTNAVLVDDEWARFLAEHRFLVGVSLDGPEEIHDAARRDRGGRGSFGRAMAGVEALRRRGAEINALAVVGPHNAGRAAEVMEFFAKEGLSHVQIMPAMGFQSVEPHAVPRYLIGAKEWGEFLVEAFDAWFGDGWPRLSVRGFDNLLRVRLGLPQDLCIHGDLCDSGLVVEWNGDVYPCDFYVHPGYRLGNALASSVADLARAPARREFVLRKRRLSEECSRCEWLAFCGGGCARNRVAEPDGALGRDVLCSAYRRLFSHAAPRIDDLADRVSRAARTLVETSGRRVGRNDPCPCGSGRKHKSCCGHPGARGSYLLERSRREPIRPAWTAPGGG